MATTPSGASQRLLTMKFMQRAAAAASPTSPSTPTSDDGHSSKRRKTAGRSSLGAPETPSYVIDQKVAQAALDAEERKREALIEKQAEKLGDSHWVLDPTKLPRADQQRGAPLNIVQVGFSQIDRKETVEEKPDEADGPSFRSYGPSKKKATEDDSDSDSGSDSDSNSDSDSDSDSDSSDSSSEDSGDELRNKPGRSSYGSQKRQEIRSRKSAERDKAKQFAAKRREKEVKLNKLTSISGAGSSSFGSKGSNFGRRR